MVLLAFYIPFYVKLMKSDIRLINGASKTTLLRSTTRFAQTCASAGRKRNSQNSTVRCFDVRDKRAQSNARAMTETAEYLTAEYLTAVEKRP